MKWFGKSWGSPLCKDGERMDVPVGRACEVCAKAFVASDQGIGVPWANDRKRPPAPYHVVCFLRSIGIPTCEHGRDEEHTIACDDPQCGDSTWDHMCNAGWCPGPKP